MTESPTPPERIDHALLALLDQLAQRGPLPRVRALHLPPLPAPGELRGEFCALELDDGAIGLGYVLLGDTHAGLLAQAGRLNPAGQPALAVASGYASADALQRTIGLAAINALTSSLYRRAGYVPPPAGDSLGALNPQPGDLLGMVGFFAPLVPRILASGARLRVLELRADLVRDEGALRVTQDPAELAECGQVLATGTLLLNDTLDATLAHCRQARALALIGPSVGCPPDPLWARGVTLLGGTWVLDPDAYLERLVRGQPSGDSARKSSITPADYPGWPALLARC